MRHSIPHKSRHSVPHALSLPAYSPFLSLGRLCQRSPWTVPGGQMPLDHPQAHFQEDVTTDNGLHVPTSRQIG